MKYTILILSATALIIPAPAEAARPKYCAIFEMVDHSCTGARLLVKMFGRADAERRARACGATDADINLAGQCLAKHGE